MLGAILPHVASEEASSFWKQVAHMLQTNIFTCQTTGTQDRGLRDLSDVLRKEEKFKSLLF